MADKPTPLVPPDWKPPRGGLFGLAPNPAFEAAKRAVQALKNEVGAK